MLMSYVKVSKSTRDDIEKIYECTSLLSLLNSTYNYKPFYPLRLS